MPTLEKYPECGPDNAVSCRVAFRLTHNETVGDIAEWVIGKPLAIAGLIIVALIARWLIFRVIDRSIRGLAFGPNSTRRALRAKTLGSLLRSIVTGVMFAVVLMMVLSEFGFSVAPLLASAGVLGVAIGFGAQSLVKDFLSGIFMIFEDQYGVGDVVDVGEASGTVEAVGLRVSRIRDVNGTVWYVRNGEILRVGNMSQNWARTVLDVAVAYSEDVERVRRVLQEVAHGLSEDEAYQGLIIEEPEVWGIESFAADTVNVRVTMKTAPMEQWKVAREMRERIKARFDKEGIKVPAPQRVTVQQQPPAGSDESGE